MTTTQARMPEQANLEGIVYRIQESEGLIVFAQRDKCGPCMTRISFERVLGVWYVSIDDYENRASVGHITKAHELVVRIYGDSFKGKNGPNKP